MTEKTLKDYSFTAAAQRAHEKGAEEIKAILADPSLDPVLVGSIELQSALLFAFGTWLGNQRDRSVDPRATLTASAHAYASIMATFVLSQVAPVSVENCCNGMVAQVMQTAQQIKSGDLSIGAPGTISAVAHAPEVGHA